jgi:hypothetical protein
MDDFSEFFQFTLHAHFVAFAIHMAGLFEKRNDTINLGRLADDVKVADMPLKTANEVDALLREAKPLAAKVILRRNLRDGGRHKGPTPQPNRNSAQNRKPTTRGQRAS